VCNKSLASYSDKNLIKGGRIVMKKRLVLKVLTVAAIFMLVKACRSAAIKAHENLFSY